MPEDAGRSQLHRPAILVGFGGYGLKLLRQLLKVTEPRRRLHLEPVRGADNPVEREFLSFSMLCAGDEKDLPAPGPLDLDIYRKIHVVPLSAPTDLLTESLLSHSERLLRGAGFPGNSAADWGLDIMVLAHLRSVEDLKELEHKMRPAMTQLWHTHNLKYGVGAGPLNFIFFLDFDNYWKRTRGQRDLREALQAAVRSWDGDDQESLPPVGRLYLTDGQRESRSSNEEDRIEETCVFLEFLLFEGQRGNQQEFYQSTTGQVSPVSTFGVRLMEHNTELARQLSAANFTKTWLDHLDGAGKLRHEDECRHLRKCLAPFIDRSSSGIIDTGEVRRIAAKHLAELESRLVGELDQLDVLGNWPDRVESEHGETLKRIQRDLASQARELMDRVARERLQGLAKSLTDAVTSDLHDEGAPTSLTVIRDEIQSSINWLGQEILHDRKAAGKIGSTTRTVHSKYGLLRESQIDPSELKKWWPMFALVLAGALTPLAVSLLDFLDEPTVVASSLAVYLPLLSNPVTVSSFFFVSLWLLGAKLAHRFIVKRSERARRYFLDAERGRLADRLKADLATGGALRYPVDAYVHATIADMEITIKEDVIGHLRRALGLLETRLQELKWLRNWTHAFLRESGIDPDSGGMDPLREPDRVRMRVDLRKDYLELKDSLPAVEDRFRDAQGQQRPLAGWHDEYSRTFLYPSEFLERLAPLFPQRDPGGDQEAGGSQYLEEFRQFVDPKVGGAGLGFLFKTQEGVPTAVSYSLLPPEWCTNEYLELLRNVGAEEKVAFKSAEPSLRAYLVRTQADIALQCLAGGD
jgi:hypothetical protein